MIVGLDVHKKETVAFVARGSLESGEWLRVPTTHEGLSELLPILGEALCVIEASTSGKAVARWLRNHGARVDLLVADVLQSHMRRAKSDAIDARDLAKIGLVGGYRTCYVPTAEEEEVRSCVRNIRDIRDRITQIKNQVKAVAQRNLVPEPQGNMENEHVQRRWQHLNIGPMEQEAINSKLRLLTTLVNEEEHAMGELCQLVEDNEHVQRLLGIKGVDTYTASVIVSHCGDFSRFAEGKKVASYAGLAPKLNQSGNNTHHGRITKAGPNLLRHALIEAAHNVVKHAGRLKLKYARLRSTRGSGRAIVAIARTLITAIWRMCVTNQPYLDLDDELQEAKAWRMKTVATLHKKGDRSTVSRLLRLNDLPRAYRAWKNGRSKIVPTGGPS